MIFKKLCMNINYMIKCAGIQKKILRLLTTASVRCINIFKSGKSSKLFTSQNKEFNTNGWLRKKSITTLYLTIYLYVYTWKYNLLLNTWANHIKSSMKKSLELIILSKSFYESKINTNKTDCNIARWSNHPSSVRRYLLNNCFNSAEHDWCRLLSVES